MRSRKRPPAADPTLPAIEQIFAEIEAYPLTESFVDEDAASLDGAHLPWDVWASRFLPTLFRAQPGEHHVRAWEWFESLPENDTPPALVLAWPRGGGKSAILEAACARLAFTLRRRFVLYVSRTQAQANKHVQSIRAYLTRAGVTPRLTEFGQSQGWSASLLRTQNGFNVLALGIEAAGRGVRFDEFRPDLILVDDIDERHDTPKITKKVIEILTESILPTGSPFCGVAVGQNVILEGGVCHQLVSGKAEFLTERIVSFVRAVEGFVFDHEICPDGTRRPVIKAGRATWAGLSLKALGGILAKIGVRAFLREYQHEVSEEGGGLWESVPLRYLQDDPPEVERDERGNRLLDPTGLPFLLRVVVALDPSGSARGDEVGLVAAGQFLLASGVHAALILEDGSDHLSPLEWAGEAVAMVRRWEGVAPTLLLGEANFGGEMVAATIKTVQGAPGIKLVHASRGKLVRAETPLKLYEEGRIWHRRRFPTLEGQMKRWSPGSGQPSPGALDAMVFAVVELLSGLRYLGEGDVG